MTEPSAARFAGSSRVHVALAVRDLTRSLAFYRVLLGAEPTKTRPKYAKFETAEPPLNLALNEVPEAIGPNHPVAHFGIEVKTSDAVLQAAVRLRQAGFETRLEDRVSCCYAVQNKVWVSDPDGNRWEVFVVLESDAATYAPSTGMPGRDMQSLLAALTPEQQALLKSAIERAGVPLHCGPTQACTPGRAP